METQVSITEWAIKTFGRPEYPTTIIDRFTAEVNELEDTAYSDSEEETNLKDECADCLIVLYQVASALGFDLHDAVDEKMQTNRARRWHVKGDGTGQHI